MPVISTACQARPACVRPALLRSCASAGRLWSSSFIGAGSRGVAGSLEAHVAPRGSGRPWGAGPTCEHGGTRSEGPRRVREWTHQCLIGWAACSPMAARPVQFECFFALHLRPFCSEATVLSSAHLYTLQAVQARAVCSVQQPMPVANASRVCVTVVSVARVLERITTVARAELGSIFESAHDLG